MAKIAVAFVLFIAVTVAPALCQESELEIKPSARELLVKDGAAQDLVCSVSSKEKDAQLNWITPSDAGVTRLEQTEIKDESIYRLQYSLKIANFSAVNVGDYICELKAGGDTKSKRISLNPVKETISAPVFDYDEKSPAAALWCSISFSSTERTIESIEWLKDDKKVELSGKKYSLIKENNTLIIHEPERDDAGLYIARFRIKSNSSKNSDKSVYEHDCEVEYLAGPMVGKFDKSKNLIQEDDMELQCIVRGYPKAVVTWYKDNQLLNVSKGDSKRVQQMPLNGYQNARLKIKDVEFSDAGEYTCEAYSAYFNESDRKSITVRVKDKLAALWPFLGIVGEVVVLCTIIFIYEKRRNKQAEQEENTAQEAKNDEKKGGVRHRGQKK